MAILDHLEEEFPIARLDINALAISILDRVDEDEVRVDLHCAIPSEDQANLVPSARGLVIARRGGEREERGAVLVAMSLVLDAKPMQLELLPARLTHDYG